MPCSSAMNRQAWRGACGCSAFPRRAGLPGLGALSGWAEDLAPLRSKTPFCPPARRSRTMSLRRPRLLESLLPRLAAAVVAGARTNDAPVCTSEIRTTKFGLQEQNSRNCLRPRFPILDRPLSDHPLGLNTLDCGQSGPKPRSFLCFVVIFYLDWLKSYLPKDVVRIAKTRQKQGLDTLRMDSATQ